MPFRAGRIRCENCLEWEDEHCQTCLSCNTEPIQECCMEGWTEEAKDVERRHWASFKSKAEGGAG